MMLLKTAILLASLFAIGLCQVPLLGTWSVYYPLNNTIPSWQECILIGDITFTANPANDSTVLMTVYEWNGYCPADYISGNTLTYIIPFPSNFTFDYDFDLSDGQYPTADTPTMDLNSSVSCFFQYGYYNYEPSQKNYTKYAGLSYIIDGNFMITMGAFKVISDQVPLLGNWYVYYPLNNTIPSWQECILIGDVTFTANPANYSTTLMTVYEWNGYCPADYISNGSLTYIIPFPSDFTFTYDFDLSDGEYPVASTATMSINSSVSAYFQYGYYNYERSQKNYTKYAALSYIVDDNFMIDMGAFKLKSTQTPLLGTWSVYYPPKDIVPGWEECILIGDITFSANPSNYSTVLMTVYEWNGYCPADYISNSSLTYIVPFPSDFTFDYDFDLSDGQYPVGSTPTMNLNSSVSSYFQYGFYNYDASTPDVQTQYISLDYIVDGNFMIDMGAMKVTGPSALIES